MTTESLCSLGQQHKRQRQQTIDSETTKEEEEEEDEKQVAEEDRRRRRRKRRVGGGKVKAAAGQREDDNIRGTGNYRRPAAEDDDDDRELTGGGPEVCDNSINRLQRSGGSEPASSDNRLVDSRSILTNKNRLKRFWEHKMEMEFKLRQQKQQQQQLQHQHQHQDPDQPTNLLVKNPTVATRRSNGQQPVKNSQNHQKLAVTFDENNNNNNNNNSLVEDDEKQIGDQQQNNNNGQDQDHDQNDKNSQQQQQQFSEDEEWRSLSPNVEPTNGTFKMASSSMINSQQQQQQQPSKQVSASLVCEKLREYRATTASQRQQTTTPTATSKPEEEPTMPEGQQKVSVAAPAAAGESKSSQQVPIIMNNSNRTNTTCNSHANGHLDENQLMSIDPTLCHSSGGGSGTNQEGTELAATCYVGNNDNRTAAAAAAEQQIACHHRHLAAAAATEEQTVNEEFSSVSSSSFGPMSISIAMNNTPTTNNKQKDKTTTPKQSNRAPEVNGGGKLRGSSDFNDDDYDNYAGGGGDDDSGGEEEEESNSAQSGSVLTVITAGKNLDGLKAGSRFGPPSSINESTSDEQASDVLHDTTTSSSINPQPFMSSDTSNEPQSSSLADNDEDSLVDDDDGGSNIGVAFESLHFDSEIKSSKHEKVDEMLLGPPLPPPPVAPPAAKHRSMVPKFNANEVKSVCNFITAAISDATRQVESYMRNDDDDSPPSPPAATGEGENKLNHGGGSIQRATFVQQSDVPFHHQGSPPKKSIEPSQRKLGSTLAPKNNDGAIDDDDDDDDDDTQIDEDNSEAMDVPKADLSSIFEANVRREIQRFETNSVVKKPKVCSAGSKLMNKNGLTEWRIAEEIRLFNEREMELKKRFGQSEDGQKAGDPSNSNQTGRPTNQQVTANTNGTTNKQQQQVVEPKPRQNQHQSQQQAIVRFGKTLQLPKPVSAGFPKLDGDVSSNNTNNHHHQHIMSQKSIKLSTVANGSGSQNGIHQQPTTSISMHKFIASGGKRFVFTSSSSSATSAGSQQQLTKSMSNLSIVESVKSEQPTLPAKTVDYKAIDSLKCKETPNVRPGITRKVIESFLRMNTGSSSSSPNHKSPANNPDGNVTSGCQSSINSQGTNVRSTWSSANQSNGHLQPQQHLAPSKQQSSASSCSSFSSSSASSASSISPPSTAAAAAAAVAVAPPPPPPPTVSNSNQPQSAEHKIQEELREMRAREAELRSQRLMLKSQNQSPASNGLDNNNNNNNNNQFDRPSADSDCDSNGKYTTAEDRLVEGAGSGPEVDSHDHHRMQAADRLCFSSESLYPIKQTIDSFRKQLNNSLNNQAGNNSILPHMPMQQQNMRKKFQLQATAANEHQDNTDDYDSRVGGERRKISMIEKWENRRLQ